MWDWFTGPTLAIGTVVVLTIGALVAWGVLHLERRRHQDEDAVRLTEALSEPFAREPALAGAGVMPVVTRPWRGRPRVELTGWVPSREVRDAAVRAVEREAARLGRPVHIVDSLQVVEPARRPA
jgi:hypothetical protein